MQIEETDSFLVFRDVSQEALVYFKDMPYPLWFLEGVASDNIFQQTFIGSGLDLSEYDPFKDNDDDIKVTFTLYYIKTQPIENIPNKVQHLIDEINKK